LGTFINIHIDYSELPPEQARRLPPLCPVDIFVMTDGRLKVRPDNEDECTLCELCLEAAARGAITIRKAYKDEALVSRGG
jgi:NAD-dependent dihydropyrimidine dehydrogenase PreA subunit